MEHLRHLSVKISPSEQGALPHGATCRAGRPRVKKKAARRSSGHKKMLMHSQHHHVKTARRLRQRRMDTKTRLHLHDELR